MRVVVLALTLALAGKCRLSPDFAAGKTYVYKYETWLLGGLPEEGLGRAGLKVRSKVLISAIEHNMLMLKLAEPEFFEYSGVWPKDAFTPATKLTSVLAPQLMIPIKFESRCNSHHLMLLQFHAGSSSQKSRSSASSFEAIYNKVKLLKHDEHSHLKSFG
uniref:Vitellogenin domain-containing protein n=1 Tax=Hippocampus comes TaxID=109280 RepID=A0A3Q2YML9_HIPCM